MRHLPNALTLFRLVSAPVLAALLCSQGAAWEAWAAFALFAAAACTDHLDGFLARRWQVQSDFGRQLDPVADKVLIAAGLLGLAVSDRLEGVHLVAAAVILLREIVISALREWLAQKDTVLPVMPLARVKTTAQSVGIGLLLAVPLWQAAAAVTFTAGLALLWIAAALTAWTGVVYLRRTASLLRRPVEHVS